MTHQSTNGNGVTVVGDGVQPSNVPDVDDQRGREEPHFHQRDETHPAGHDFGIVSEGAVLASGVVMASGKKIYDEAAGEVVPPLEMIVGTTTYLIPVIPPYRLAVGGSLLSASGTVATDAIILKPGDLRDTDTLKHFEKQGILYQ